MKLDDAGPPRLDTNGPESLRKFVRARQRGPSDASLERMSKRLATARGMATSAMNSERGGKGAEAPFAYYKLGLVARRSPADSRFSGNVPMQHRLLRRQSQLSLPLWSRPKRSSSPRLPPASNREFWGSRPNHPQWWAFGPP